MRNPKRDPAGPLKTVPGTVARRATQPAVVVGVWDGVAYRLEPSELVDCTIDDLRHGTPVRFSPGFGLRPTARRLTLDV